MHPRIKLSERFSGRRVVVVGTVAGHVRVVNDDAPVPNHAFQEKGYNRVQVM